ncbi:MAG: ABC transporter ATP-binding protein [Chloroflexi bacterium]|nr:ABC transporter ATP-binding protein [Chloroflexota bacterium]
MQMQLEQVGFSYDGSRQIFQGIDFEVNAGEIVCLLGPNGIGKTTLLTCMAKLREPNQGRILLNGEDMAGLSTRDVARVIGYVPQTLQPSFDFTVLDYVVTGSAPWLGTFEKPNAEHYERAAQALKQMEIDHLRDKAYTRISTGELQQVSIARAIAQQSRFILMDEPTAHLDLGNQVKVLRLVKGLAAEGYGIVLTTHNPDQVLLLEAKVAVIDRQARFHFGNWQQILTENLLSDLYGVEMRLIKVEGIQRELCVAPKL